MADAATAMRDLVAAGRLAEAEALARQMLEITPDQPDANATLARAAMARGDRTEAERLMRRVVAARPTAGEDWLLLGRLVERNAGWAASRPMFERAAALLPGNVQAHTNLGAALLAEGDYIRGWEEYEHRQGVLPEGLPILDSPVWDGAAPEGRTILVLAEQGLGDTLQFCRYAPLLAERGADVVLYVQRGLVRLLADSFPRVRVLGWGEAIAPHHAHIRLMSLPHRFATRLDTVPAAIPYLRAEAGGGFGTFAVGLAWGGNPENPAEGRRSLPLESLAPLWRAAGTAFVSLQAGEAAAQARPGLPLVDPMPRVADFADTARIVAALDLVISVDTSVAHLAGALGRPVWLLSRFDSCWRWLTGREDSPWYPTMRLFRQPAPGAWEPVVVRVAAELDRVLSARRGP